MSSLETEQTSVGADPALAAAAAATVRVRQGGAGELVRPERTRVVAVTN